MIMEYCCLFVTFLTGLFPLHLLGWFSWAYLWRVTLSFVVLFEAVYLLIQTPDVGLYNNKNVSQVHSWSQLQYYGDISYNTAAPPSKIFLNQPQSMSRTRGCLATVQLSPGLHGQFISVTQELKDSLLASRDPYDTPRPCSDNLKAWELGKSRG